MCLIEIRIRCLVGRGKLCSSQRQQIPRGRKMCSINKKI